jgi:type I restriction enzyme, S subunit
MRLALNKEGWSRFRFDEIAQKISKTVNPADTDLERYIGLEHIDSEDIHIRRWGSPSDVKGGKLLCYPGDIIFGKRRAYQRKAAIVEEESICSAHAFVFRAIEEVILPEFLPFFLHSDSFMNRMVDISVGGLSPTINWGDLKNQEFLLPPKDQQGELAELLWSLNDVCRLNNVVFEKTEVFKLAYTENFVHDYRMESKISLSKALSIPEKTKAVKIDRNKILTVRLHRKGVVRNNSTHGLKLGATTYFHRKAGQFIYGKQNLHNGALGIVPEELDGFFSSSDVPALDINEKIIEPQFLLTYLGRTSFYKHLEKYSAGSGSKRISEKTLRRVKIDQFSLEDQQEFLVQNNTIKKSLKSLKENISSLSDLEKSIINQIF